MQLDLGPPLQLQAGKEEFPPAPETGLEPWDLWQSSCPGVHAVLQLTWLALALALALALGLSSL